MSCLVSTNGRESASLAVAVEPQKEVETYFLPSRNVISLSAIHGVGLKGESSGEGERWIFYV